MFATKAFVVCVLFLMHDPVIGALNFARRPPARTCGQHAFAPKRLKRTTVIQTVTLNKVCGRWIYYRVIFVKPHVEHDRTSRRHTDT